MAERWGHARSSRARRSRRARAPTRGPGPGSNGGSAACPDSDGDGVCDDVDNCPHVFNPDQHDKDGDGRGDACDVCPGIADDGTDSDGDGVGDACDPRPAQPGDSIAFFEGFYAPVAWSPVIGSNNWEYVSNNAVQPSIDDEHQLVSQPSLNNAFVQARVHVLGMNSDETVRRSSGIVLGYLATDDYYFCGLAADPTNSELDAGKEYDGITGPTFTDSTADFADQLDGDWTLITAQASLGSDGTTWVNCSAVRGAITGSTQFGIQDHVNGSVGIRTNDANVAFDYVFVVNVGD